MRALICALEHPPLMFAHPQAVFYHRRGLRRGERESEHARVSLSLRYDEDSEDMGELVSSFFIGLSFRQTCLFEKKITPLNIALFRNGMKSIDLTANLQAREICQFASSFFVYR